MFICTFMYVRYRSVSPVPPTGRPQNLEAVSTPKALLKLRFQYNSSVTGRAYRRNNWLRLEQGIYNTSGYASKSVFKDTNENYLCVKAGDLNIEDISNCYPQYKYIYIYISVSPH